MNAQGGPPPLFFPFPWQLIEWELADKPGSVVDNHSSGMCVTTHLMQPTREQRGPRHTFPYLVLLRVGFTMPLLLPATRCALTAPFHPYLPRQAVSFCCTGRRFSPPRCYLAPCPVEPGLSSIRPPKWSNSDCLANSRTGRYRGKEESAKGKTLNPQKSGAQTDRAGSFLRR